MKRQHFIVLAAGIIVIAGLWLLVSGKKSCSELSEQQCKKDDRCLSVLVPNRCDDPPCTPDAVFKECKEKPD